MRLSQTTARPFWLEVIIALITAAVFLPVLGNGWVVTDDESHFRENESYQGLGAKQVPWAFTTVHMGSPGSCSRPSTSSSG